MDNMGNNLGLCPFLLLDMWSLLRIQCSVRLVPQGDIFPIHCKVAEQVTCAQDSTKKCFLSSREVC